MPIQRLRQSVNGYPVRLLLTLACVVLCGCSRSSRPVTRASAPTVSTHAIDAARHFLSLWQMGHYTDMYRLLSSESQQALPEERFVSRFQEIANEATITATQIELVDTRQRDSDSYTYTITYQTSLFGAIKQQNSLPLVHEAEWRVKWSPSLIFTQLTDSTLVRLVVDAPARGAILDRNGQPLASNGTVATVGTSKGLMQSTDKVPDPNAAIAALSQALAVPESTIRSRLADSNLGPDSFIPLATLPYDTPAARRAEIERIPGALIEDRPQRVYPHGALAAQTLGYVGAITADQLTKLRQSGYQEGDVLGQTGLEAAFETVLRGKAALGLDAITQDGRVAAQIAHREGAPAVDVVTSLDPVAQQAAETALGDRTGTVVVLDPRDNSVLALASHPSFDPNQLVSGLSSEQFQRLQNDPARPFLNRPLLATYAPGSTFKVVTAAAGLEQGGYSPTSMLPCTPVWYGLGPDNPKKNWTTADNEPLTIAQGLMRSCDPVFYEIGLRLYQRDPNLLTREAADFGAGKPTGINGLDEASGIDPGPDWKHQMLHQPWYPGDSVNMSIGQGYLTMTPIQIANMFSAIAQGGNLRAPLLVREIRRAGNAGPPQQQFATKEIGHLPLSASTLAVIREGMRLVVQDPRGTAYSVFAGSGLDAAGKSGTAEEGGNLNHVLFAAYAPRSAPQAVVVAILDRGEFGSVEAGPITRDVLKAIVK